MRKLVLLAATVVATAGLALPAGAAGTVHLDVDVARAVPMADCDVAVAAGSNGIAVLDAAVAAGCIDSYDTATFPGFGAYVTCIDDLCQTPDETLNAVTWILYVDGSPSQVGVSSLRLAHGQRLQFSYEPWALGAPCFLLGACA